MMKEATRSRWHKLWALVGGAFLALHLVLPAFGLPEPSPFTWAAIFWMLSENKLKHSRRSAARRGLIINGIRSRCVECNVCNSEKVGG